MKELDKVVQARASHPATMRSCGVESAMLLEADRTTRVAKLARGRSSLLVHRLPQS